MDARGAFAWALVAALTLVVWLLVQPFLGWLLATGIIAFALFPVHRRLTDRIGPRLSAGLLTLLVTLLVVVPLVAVLYVVVTQGTELLATVSETDVLAPLAEAIEDRTGLAVPVESYLRAGAERLADAVGGRASTLLGEGIHALLGFFLLTFLLYYLLKDGRQLVAWLGETLPLDPDVREELFTATSGMLWAILKGHVLVAFAQGLVAGLSLLVTGVPYALVLTVAMMVLALVPVVGVAPVLGGAVVYLLVTERLLSAAFVAVWGMTTVAITDDYLRAYLIDRHSTMHSAVVLVGVLGGTYLLGAIGLFVGPVLVGLFKTTVEVLGESYGVGAASDR